MKEYLRGSSLNFDSKDDPEENSAIRNGYSHYRIKNSYDVDVVPESPRSKVWIGKS